LGNDITEKEDLGAEDETQSEKCKLNTLIRSSRERRLRRNQPHPQNDSIF